MRRLSEIWAWRTLPLASPAFQCRWYGSSPPAGDPAHLAGVRTCCCAPTKGSKFGRTGEMALPAWSNTSASSRHPGPSPGLTSTPPGGPGTGQAHVMRCLRSRAWVFAHGVLDLGLEYPGKRRRWPRLPTMLVTRSRGVREGDHRTPLAACARSSRAQDHPLVGEVQGQLLVAALQVLAEGQGDPQAAATRTIWPAAATIGFFRGG